MSRRTPLTLTPGIAGVDEAGRGPLAGPVVAAAVLLPPDFRLESLDDSKKLTGMQRERAFDLIQRHAHVAVAVAEPAEIDVLNVLGATLAAMERALGALPGAPRSAIIDGNQVPKFAPVPCSAIPKADGTYAAVAAASIVAKVTRDRLMFELATRYPGYGFERHLGYPTSEHRERLRELGPCAIHRQSYGILRELRAKQLCLALAE